MDNRNFFWLVGMAMVAIVALFAIKLAPLVKSAKPRALYLTENAIRGSEIIHNKLAFTLNFEQQKRLIDLINRSETVDKAAAVPAVLPTLDVSQINIYPFDAATIEILPLFYIGDELVYTAPVLEKNYFLRDTSQGALRQLLAQTFDP